MGNHTNVRRFGALATGTLLMMGSVPAAFAVTNGATALLVGGRGSYAQLTEEQMSTAFGGYFADYDARISVPFPGDAPFTESIPEGSDNLYNAIYAHQATLGTPITIGGVSKGAPSVVDVLYRLLEDLENTEDGLVPPEHMTVAIYGLPSRIMFLDVKYQPVPETPWETIIAFAEYDVTADFPDNPFNILALLNAIAGAEQRHVDAAFYDIQTLPTLYKVEENSLGGKTTTIVIPTERLPLLNDMYESDFWDPGYVAFLERVLRPIIDRAYSRNWFTEQKGWVEGVAPLPAPPTAPEPDPGPGDGPTDGGGEGTGGGTDALMANDPEEPEFIPEPLDNSEGPTLVSNDQLGNDDEPKDDDPKDEELDKELVEDEEEVQDEEPDEEPVNEEAESNDEADDNEPDNEPSETEA